VDTQLSYRDIRQPRCGRLAHRPIAIRVDEGVLRDMSVEANRRWRRCEEIVDTLTIPVPFEPAVFIDELARQRGTRIELIPVTTQEATPCGMVVSTDRAEYIFYAQNTTRLHQAHILLHEVGHLLCGHEGAAAVDGSVASVLLPNLPVALVRRVLGRTVYSEAEEQEAEVLASLILHRAGRGPGRPRPVVPELADGLAGLSAVFDPPQRRRAPRG
jgi:hypothetical protein